MAITSGSVESGPTISGYPAGANPLIAALRANSPAPARSATGPTTLNFPWMQNTVPNAPAPTAPAPGQTPAQPPAQPPVQPPVQTFAPDLQPGDKLPDDEEWQYIDFGEFGGQWLRVPKPNRTPPATPAPADPVPPPGGDDPSPTPTPTPAPTPAPADPFMPPDDEGRPVYPPPVTPPADPAPLPGLPPDMPPPAAPAPAPGGGDQFDMPPPDETGRPDYTPPPVDETPPGEDPGYDWEYVDFGDGFGGRYVQVPRTNYTQPAPIVPPPYTPPTPPNYDDYEYYDYGNLF